MKNKNFSKRLLIVTFFLVILILILQNFVSAFQPYSVISWVSVIYFTIFSFAVSFFGAKAAADEDKNAFIRFIMMVIMGKLFLSVILVVGYIYAAQPANRMVVLPFIPIYIIYTVFETGFLMDLAKK